MVICFFVMAFCSFISAVFSSWLFIKLRKEI